MASMVRRSSLRGRAPRIPTASIAAANLAHTASVRTCIVYLPLSPHKARIPGDSASHELRTGPRESLKVYGGRYLAGGAGTSIDGDPPKGRVLIVQWDSLDQLMKWFHSPEYARARAVGEKYGSFRVIAVDGAPQ